jgi:hypothetical protein
METFFVTKVSGLYFMPFITNVFPNYCSFFRGENACSTVFASVHIFANRLLSSLKLAPLHKLILLANGNGLILEAKHRSI